MADARESAQAAVGTIVSMTPQGRLVGLSIKIISAVVILLIIILTIIAVSLFSTGKITAGVWVAGACIGIGSFYLYARRDLCSSTIRMITGRGEDEPIEKIDELNDLKPNDWAGL